MSRDQHRREVDRIDRELLRLLAERLQDPRAIGEAKLKAGAPGYAPQRAAHDRGVGPAPQRD